MSFGLTNAHGIFQRAMDDIPREQVVTSLEKSKFFKLETAFLGYIVSDNVIKRILKIGTITEYPIPRNIRELRSFLSLTGNYRKFVRDYAKIACNCINKISRWGKWKSF